MPRMEGWINFCVGLPTLQNCTHLTFYEEEADAENLGKKTILNCLASGKYLGLLDYKSHMTEQIR